jgi:hypothetical protein
MRRRITSKPNAFSLLLREQGWLLKTAPEPMLLSLGFDEYIYVERTDRLVHLHISAGTVDWEAKRYRREPFGDYTTIYQPLGHGVGLASLQQFLESRASAAKENVNAI